MAIEIKKAVIHVLDKGADEPLLNEFELEINDDIQVFLEKHIIKSMNDDDARKGRFKDGLNIVKEVSYRILSEDDYFLEGSKEIARQLFKAIKTNSSISSTDLIVCLYEDESLPAVAILKMDYTVSFIHDIEMVENKFKINIRKQDISLPGVNQRIQKCAFVLSPVLDNDYELVILDNQISKGAEEPVAMFFLNTFLGAELVLDSKACTKILKKETEKWVRDKIKEGEPFAEEVRELVNTAIHEEDEIDIEAFSNRIFGKKEELRDEFVNNLREKGLTHEKFEVDREWVEKRLRKIRLKTDDNIEIVIDYELFGNKDKFEIINNPDGTKTVIIKNISSINHN
ncbi:nucleoid-associated protein [Acetivibrio clariflavus]|uniref:Nucleoid-associated protein n=1 Tax=Acetivibrio clariflavus (strain DSM 19732 / NBRC 101661 / EBR45) TaxID=720554 RepID=G8LVL7_ACECE|nr:nucleoid-associated protein [Acetivibrio clariflavus]AEV69653.1 nucleoid-associated protein [Acetivibrio clariflavus DSM 19732]HOQ01271.1 nucleoid-associated protein [Acetivibrio clariflavus]HPU41022.1 nucleoid-associated protein [Acetivibrio clariflavus]